MARRISAANRYWMLAFPGMTECRTDPLVIPVQTGIQEAG